jgi:L-ascorbate metabolism protein UlaG (beta-lactamase superfamily)
MRFLLKHGALAISLFALTQTSLAQIEPIFTGLERQTNGEIVLKLNAPAGVSYRIDTANNLPEWLSLVTLRSAGLVQHTDSGAPYLRSRLYRVTPVSDAEGFVGDHIATADGDVIVRPINHASFVLSWKGKTIYNDAVGAASLYNGIPRADLILVSHSHTDHFESATINSVRATNCTIVAPQAVFNSLTTTLRAITTVMANGDKKEIAGLAIEAVPAYNANHPRGQGNGYVLTIGGKRFYMTGDTGDIAEMRALPNIDVAFVCMNTPFTMNLTQAVSAVREFRPKIIYPYHFRNSDGSLTDLNSFKRQVGTDGGVEVRVRKWY